MVNLPKRLNKINEMVIECDADIIDKDLFDIYDVFDTCIESFESVVPHCRDKLNEINQRLEERASSNLEEQKDNVRQRALARLQEEVPEELETDRRAVEEPRFITTPRSKPKETND